MACARAAEAMESLGPPEQIESAMRRAMSLPEDPVDSYLAAHCADDRFDCDLLRAIALANRNWGTATGSKAAENAERWLALGPAARAAALPELALLVFTGTGDLRKVQAGQRKADPGYEQHAERLAESISELLRVQAAARLACDLAAGLRAGQAFATAYARAKRSAGVADFNDLIAWTRRLLSTPGMGEWVRYKLDRQTDHILVDEAKDTNRAQWEIVKALAAEFFSGSSEADRRHRTIFMVGDFKQAIYRFQGTDPKEFEKARRWARDNSRALLDAEDADDDGQRLAREFRDLSIDASFRSAQPVLDVVDFVIAEVGFGAMGLPAPPNRHGAHFAERPGLVELWQPFEEPEAETGGEGEEGWLDERDRLYAAALAQQVRRWLDEAPLLDTTRRPLSAGDILILVRSRGELASLIVARLFAAGVPVAGIDRLHLSKPFAVRDLLAAMGFAVQPLDDLNLANLLVSPLIGWDQQQLFDLAFGRDKATLWRTLRERRQERADFAQAQEALSQILSMADLTTPAQFLEILLSGPLSGRRKLYRRLGLVSRDPIDELLASALEFERGETPSLERFLAWFAGGEVEVQRDPSASGNAVRVMTVHGAKGLEAPYVILADATGDPAKLGGVPRTLDFPLGVDRPKVPVIRPRKAERVPPFDLLISAEEAADLEEHWRLLYVGLTRASERLVVSGVKPQGEMPEDCWHKRVERAMAALGAQPEEDALWGQAWRYRGSVPARQPRLKPPKTELAPPPVPRWALEPAPPESRPPRPLAPSARAEDREPAPPPQPGQRAAARRGILIHQLFERLPGVAQEKRNGAALHWLEHSAGLADADERREVAGLVCSILSDARFAPLFGPGSLAEAPLVATLADGRVIAGTVDRLLVGAARVSVIDFKTGRVPACESDIPAAHRAQMSAYVEALRVIFPDRDVDASLLYTGGPQLIQISG
jgi:ATP-dependent helicase/nuclease subunit A